MKRLSTIFITTCIFLNIGISQVFAFAPLGSEPIDKCNVFKSECPSHYICVTYDDGDYGRCFCDRYYGFYGPTCEKLSSGSYLLMSLCIMIFVLSTRVMYLNLKFAYQLHITGSLKQNALCRSLFFNVLFTVPIYGWAIGFFVGVTSIDKQMIFHQYIRSPLYSFFIVTFVLSTMSISLAWIETVEKTRRRPHSNWKYKFVLYATSAFALVISSISFRYSLTDMVGVFEGISVSFSYLQAKHMVTEALSVMEENGDIIVYQGASDVLHTIKRTSKSMMIYSLIISLSFFVAGFTMTMSRPKYKQQNSLPRYAQGQLCIFVVLICFYKISTTLLDYLKSSAKRHLDKPPLNRTCCQSISALCSCLCCWGCDCQETNTIQRHVELGDSSHHHAGFDSTDGCTAADANSSILPRDGDLNTRRDIARIRTQWKRLASENRILRQLLSTMSSIDTPPMKSDHLNIGRYSTNDGSTTMILVTVNPTSYHCITRVVVYTHEGMLVEYVGDFEEISAVSSIPDESISQNNVGAAADISGGGDGGEEKREGKESCMLSKGSHAFVKCYGEPFLRCTLDSSDFGYAKGHELMANSSQVLMAGEIEVNEQGIVTRWLNKSGLYMPPRWALGQSGLPFELAWLYLSEHEVAAMDLKKREALQSSGSLINITTTASIGTITSSSSLNQGDPTKEDDDVEKGGRGESNVFTSPQQTATSTTIFPALLKISENMDNTWPQSLGTSAYIGTREAAARVKHLIMGSKTRVQVKGEGKGGGRRQRIVLPSDMIYENSKSIAPHTEDLSQLSQISALTEDSGHSCQSRDESENTDNSTFKHLPLISMRKNNIPICNKNFQHNSNGFDINDDKQIIPSVKGLGTPLSHRQRDRHFSIMNKKNHNDNYNHNQYHNSSIIARKTKARKEGGNFDTDVSMFFYADHEPSVASTQKRRNDGGGGGHPINAAMGTAVNLRKRECDPLSMSGDDSDDSGGVVGVTTTEENGSDDDNSDDISSVTMPAALKQRQVHISVSPEVLRILQQSKSSNSSELSIETSELPP